MPSDKKQTRVIIKRGSLNGNKENAAAKWYYAVTCEDQRGARKSVAHLVHDTVDGERGSGHSDSEFDFKRFCVGQLRAFV